MSISYGTTEVRGWCNCGESFFIRSDIEMQARRAFDEWRGVHDAAGHKHCDQADCEKARRKRARQAAHDRRRAFVERVS